MTPPAITARDDDDELPALAPLDPDEGVVEIPDDLGPDAWEGSMDDVDGDDDVDAGAVLVTVFGDEGGDDEGTPDDPIDALPDDDRGEWVGDDERPSDEVAEISELPRDVPDAGEDGPTRDPYDEVDTALPALDDGDEDDGPVEGSP